MSTGVIIVIVVVAVVVIALIALAMRRPQMRSRRLKEQFGPEYERTVSRHDGNAREAESELEERITHSKGLDVRPLDDAQREHYLARWSTLQGLFVDDPAQAIIEADQLLTSGLHERGYPKEDLYDALSVHHADALPGYRASRDAAERAPSTDTSTEVLREAFVNARTTFDSLVLDDQGRTTNGTPRPAHSHRTTTLGRNEQQSVTQGKGMSDE